MHAAQTHSPGPWRCGDYCRVSDTRFPHHRGSPGPAVATVGVPPPPSSTPSGPRGRLRSRKPGQHWRGAAWPRQGLPWRTYSRPGPAGEPAWWMCVCVWGGLDGEGGGDQIGDATVRERAAETNVNLSMLRCQCYTVHSSTRQPARTLGLLSSSRKLIPPRSCQRFVDGAVAVDGLTHAPCVCHIQRGQDCRTALAHGPSL